MEAVQIVEETRGNAPTNRNEDSSLNFIPAIFAQEESADHSPFDDKATRA
jgi:hypothetical protein